MSDIDVTLLDDAEDYNNKLADLMRRQNYENYAIRISYAFTMMKNKIDKIDWLREGF